MKPEYIILITVVALLIFLIILKTTLNKGKFGEFLVSKTLKKTKEGKRYVFKDFIVSLDGQSSEIDHILINKNGIFVIETKNYKGKIYGKEADTEWTQVLANGKVINKLYNPIKQNKTHIYRLKSLFPNNVHINSLVVFIKDNFEKTSNIVISRKQLKKVINNPSCNMLSKQQMKDYYNILLNAKNNCKITHRKHKKHLKKNNKLISKMKCPRCKSKLFKDNDYIKCSNCNFIKK